jgi:glutamate synthase (NADPH/NADH) large chain
MPMAAGSIEKGIARLCRYAEDAVDDGFEVLILERPCY